MLSLTVHPSHAYSELVPSSLSTHEPCWMLPSKINAVLLFTAHSANPTHVCNLTSPAPCSWRRCSATSVAVEIVAQLMAVYLVMFLVSKQ